MNRWSLGWRILVLTLAFACLAPVQALSNRLGWRLSGVLPVVFHRLFLALFGVRVAVEGAPPSGPALVLANHLSWLDIAVLGSVVPLSFIAKSEIAGWPIAGQFARLQRTIFIDRARKTHTAKVNAAVAARLARGDVVVLFAEGTTGDGNRILPFRASLVGAARAALAQTAIDHVALRPLTLAYVRRGGLPVTRRERPDIAWYGDMTLKDHLAAFVRGGPLDALVVWGEPIAFDARSDRKDATARAEAAVRAVMRRAVRGRFEAPAPSAASVQEA